METENQLSLADEVLILVDDVLGDNPWVRVGVSAVLGFVVGLAGGQIVRSGARLALSMGAQRLARYAFDAAFEAGHRDAIRLAGGRRIPVRQAAERSY